MASAALKRNGIHCYKLAKINGLTKQSIEGHGHIGNSPAPVAFWDFEESSGTVAEDYSENGTDHDADTTDIAAHSTTYKAAGSRSVTLGANDRVEVADHAHFDWAATTKWTVSSYTATDSTSYTGIYVKREGSGGAYRGPAIFANNGNLEIYLVDTWGTVGSGDKSVHIAGTGTSTNFKEAGVYHHILVTYSGGANAASFTAWIDGVKHTVANSKLAVQASRDTLGTSDTVVNNVTVALGNDSATTSLNSGGVDHTTIWKDVEITDAQAAAIYNSGTAIDCRRGL